MSEPQTPSAPLPGFLREHHSGAIEALTESWSREGQIGHAFLITGPTGAGKRETALHLAEWLGCENNPGSGAADPEASPALFAAEAPARAAKDGAVPCPQCSACRGIETGQSIYGTENRAEVSDTGRVGTLKV